MHVGLLTAAVCAGFVLAALWLAVGGSVLSALGIYAVSGNLLIIGLIAGQFLRSDSFDT